MKYTLHLSLAGRFILPPILIALATLVAGCGGGGGGSNPVAASSAPVASSGVLSVTEDQPTASALNARDADQEPLIFSIVTNATMGSVVITDSTTGAYVYTPDPDANGVDSFTFKASDGTGDSNPATITINITAIEDPPIASALTVAATEDTPVQSALHAIDGDNDLLTYSIVSNGTQGSVVIDDPATGSYTYTPNPDANGVDIFTFKANDGQTDSNPAAVTITIAPVNDSPVATGGCTTTPQAQTLNGTLQAIDLETPLQLMYSLEDGSTGPFTAAKGGEVTITDPTTGTFTYTPASLASGGERGTDTFVFRVTDPDGAVSTDTESVIVNQTIMPLGDSLTQGAGGAGIPPAETRVGFRKTLYDMLIADGYSFDFVGTLTHGYGVPNFDSHHEGHGGWTASEIAWGRTGFPSDGVRAWLDTNPSDIVLLHAGTNGFDANNDIDVEAILDEIDIWEASANGNPVTVLLALIIDWNPLNLDVPVFNSNLLAMANNRIANGDDIIIVNQHDALTYPGDMADTLHPTAGGYDKMAGAWFTPLVNVMEKCP